MTLYFGTPWGPAVGHPELMIPAPVGTLCARCDEPIAPDDTGAMSVFLDAETEPSVRPEHRECFLRVIVGSVGHQDGRCACFGGNEEDPEGMSKREAARAAVTRAGIR